MLRADYFDGRSTRVRAVDVSLAGSDLVIAGQDVDLRIPVSQIVVDERLGRAPRKLRFADGAFCEVRDLDALDGLLSQAGLRDGWVDRMQRHGRFILLSVLACAALAVAGYEWVLPGAAALAARKLPPAVARSLSTQTLKFLDGKILVPSKVPEARRQSIDAEYHALRLPDGGTPIGQLLFRGSPQFGANAFTLPDGTIIVLDGLLAALGDDSQVMAVLAHELGHAHGRHGMQLLLQSSAVGAFLAFYVGDISSLLAAAPAAVVQARYSQDLEQQADDYGAALLMRNGMSPALLADALEKLAQSRPGSAQGGYLSSHPPTDERMQHLRQLAVSFAEQ